MKNKINYCRSCGVLEGEFHIDNCEKERCKKHKDKRAKQAINKTKAIFAIK